MIPGAGRAEAGFTLLEILVAFTIATMALGLLFRVHSTSTATIVLSKEYQEATAIAQTLIAEHSVTESRLEFTTAGSADPYAWVVRGNAYSGANADAGAQQPPYQLRAIAAEVRWSGRDRDRRVTVSTVKPFFEPEA